MHKVVTQFVLIAAVKTIEVFTRDLKQKPAKDGELIFKHYQTMLGLFLSSQKACRAAHLTEL